MKSSKNYLYGGAPGSVLVPHKLLPFPFWGCEQLRASQSVSERPHFEGLNIRNSFLFQSIYIPRVILFDSYEN